MWFIATMIEIREKCIFCGNHDQESILNKTTEGFSLDDHVAYFAFAQLENCIKV